MSEISYYSDGSWVERKTTQDLKDIIDYLSLLNEPIVLLQIGVGNSSLYVNCSHQFSSYYGVTVDSRELYKFHKIKRELNPECHAQVFQMDKNHLAVDTFCEDFDYIVDNDLSSYSCCKIHFFKMLDVYNKLLKNGGSILIGKNGLMYADTGFPLTVGLAKKIMRKHGFNFTETSHCYVATKVMEMQASFSRS